MTPSWIEAMRGVSVLAVAQQLGLSVAPPRGSSGGVIYRCAVCAAERPRSGQAHVYSGGKGCGVLPSGRGWSCFACRAKGDALSLVCAVLGGSTRYSGLTDAAKKRVRAWCAEFTAGRATAGELTTQQATPSHVSNTPALEQHAVQTGAGTYPDASSLSKLLRRTRLLRDDPACVSWCAQYGIDPARFGTVAEGDHYGEVAALRSMPGLPEWAQYGRHTWPVRGYRLIVPLCAPDGTLRSVIARRVTSGQPKSLPPRGHIRRGLVMMNRWARQVLRAGTHPATWVTESEPDDPFGCDGSPWWNPSQPLVFLIAEGEKDFLTQVSRQSATDEYAPAVLGIVSGGWSQELADRLPSAPPLAAVTRVILMLDDDRSGDKYADEIKRSLAARVRRGDIEVSIWKGHRL